MKHPLRFLFLLLACCHFVLLMAAPARRGHWIQVLTNDGKSINVEFLGDERIRYARAVDGTCYVLNKATGRYQEVSSDSIVSNAAKRYASVSRRFAPAARRAEAASSIFSGNKRGLVILVEFPNKQFCMADPVALYRKITNEPDYHDNGFQGSVRDYFIAQSGGKFILDFDVAGPVMMSHPYDYYGNDDEKNIGDMVIEACKGVQDSIDFSRYDWDGDGEAEEVFVLFAGYGQNDYDSSNDSLIWPLMFTLEEDRKVLKINGTKINTYACSNELKYDGKIAGIGTFCHEFSHCMGFPDVYDVQDKGSFAMDAWDLMDYGSYNGDGYLPAGYTAYEKMTCGWLTPVELGKQSLEVTDMKPLADGGQAYLIRHPQYENEYFLLENRQPVGFDKLLPGSGVLITHVDYDKEAWEANAVNTIGLYNGYYNDHLRLALVPADGIASRSTIAHDAYPYGSRNSFSDSSTPAATLFHDNDDGSKLLHCSVSNISVDGDGVASFVYSPDSDAGINREEEVYLLKETFSNCVGIGGNDGLFKGRIASGHFDPDLKGWRSVCNAYAGDRCARFGSSGSAADKTFIVSTPYFTLPGDTVMLTFRVAGWNTKSEGTDLQLFLSQSDAQFTEAKGATIMTTMQKGQWQTYAYHIVGKGSCSLTFIATGRFFLDDVYITKPVATGIHDLPVSDKVQPSIYSLSGQNMGTDPSALPKGIYIINHHKVILGK
jgi:M6 family metalloprotease-like protein